MDSLDKAKSYRDLRLWGCLTARRYRLTPQMVQTATDRRLVGDWRGACEAAWFDVGFNIDEVRRQHGTTVARAVQEDLLHLSPDLVRWHLPEELNGTGRFSAMAVVLAEYEGGVVLTAHTPSSNWPQRVLLRCGPGSADDGRKTDTWVPARYLWDTRHSAGLLARLGGGDRLPFFDRYGRRQPASQTDTEDDPAATTERFLELLDSGDHARAWESMGLRLPHGFPAPSGTGYSDPGLPAGMAALMPVLMPRLREIFAAPDAPPRVHLIGRIGPSYSEISINAIDGELVAHRGGLALDQVRGLPRILWQRMPDLELLRAGAISADELHPLVRSALFPDLAPAPFAPRVWPSGASTLDGWQGEDLPVGCAGRRHRMGFRDSDHQASRDRRLVALDHSAEDVARERALRNLGGPVAACVEALDAWLISGQLPPALADLRSHWWLSITHGHLDEVHRLLDLGFDPTAPFSFTNDRALHHLAKVADDGSLLRLLLEAGLDINHADKFGATPLRRALVEGGSRALVAAMLEAGAEPLSAVLPDGRLTATLTDTIIPSPER